MQNIGAKRMDLPPTDRAGAGAGAPIASVEIFTDNNFRDACCPKPVRCFVGLHCISKHEKQSNDRKIRELGNFHKR